MNIELKNFKHKLDHGRLDSFSATVWIDGEAVFHASRDPSTTGMGMTMTPIPDAKFGSVDIRFGPNGLQLAKSEKAMALAEEWTKTLPARYINSEYEESISLLLYVDSLVDQKVLEKELKRLTNKKIAFIQIDKNEVCSLFTIDLPYTEVLAKGLIESNKTLKGMAGTLIINDLPVPVALRLISNPSLALAMLTTDEDSSPRP